MKNNRYAYGAMWFILLNMLFIFVQAQALQSSRLGEDSLTYLTKKVKTETLYSFHTSSMGPG